MLCIYIYILRHSCDWMPLCLSDHSYSCQIMGLKIVQSARFGDNSKIRFLSALDRALGCGAILHATNVNVIFFWFILAAYDNLKPSRKQS